VASGYADAEKLLPITFGVIIATVLAHGLSIGALAQRLKLAARGANGLLIVGASPWTAALARALKTLEIDVLLVDGSYRRLKDARMEGISVYYGEILSDHAEHTLETRHLSHLLCATENDFYNALVCKAQGRNFGHHRTFQLATLRAEGPELKRLTLQQRGHFAFDPGAHYAGLHEHLHEGWTVQTTRFSPSYGFAELKLRLGQPGKDWLLLGGVSPTGAFRLYSDEQRFRLESGWTAIVFAPEQPAARSDAAQAEPAADPLTAGAPAPSP
jgi:CPA1 family monovalent cation:H+ antiporter